MDPVMRPESLIKDEWWAILDKSYRERLMDDLPVWDSDQLDDSALMKAIEEILLSDFDGILTVRKYSSYWFCGNFAKSHWYLSLL